jgi:hypothetical protein
MPNSLTLAIQDYPIFRESEVSIRHDPAFGIAPVMPNAALPEDLRPSLSSGGRRVGANPVPIVTCLCANNRAIPRMQTALPQRGK